METNETLEQLFCRKSVRAYEERPVETEKLDAILRAAIEAPTAGNMMLYSIINITDQITKDKLAISCDNQPFIAKAPIVLVFCADYQRWYDAFTIVAPAAEALPLREPGKGDFMLAACDAIIAAQNVVIAAQSLGLGSCYIGDILEKSEYHNELLRLPQYVAPVCMLCIGYPTEQQIKRTKPQRFKAQYIVYENEYQKQTPAQIEEMFATQSESKSDYDMIKSVGAMLKRKWNCDFSREMTRSVVKMLEKWA